MTAITARPATELASGPAGWSAAFGLRAGAYPAAWLSAVTAKRQICEGYAYG